MKRLLVQPGSRKSGELAWNEEGSTDDKEKSKLLELTELEIKDVPITFGIPLAPMDEKMKSGLTFVLDKASLVLAYDARYQILNPDEHADFLRRKSKNPYNYRPDIVHEVLLQIMDSPRLYISRLMTGI